MGRLRLRRRHFASLFKALASTLYPEARVRIQDNVLSPFICQRLQHQFAQLSPEFGVQARLLIYRCDSGMSKHPMQYSMYKLACRETIHLNRQFVKRRVR